MGITNFPEENIDEILTYLPKLQTKSLNSEGPSVSQAAGMLLAFDRLGFTRPGFDYNSWLQSHSEGFATDKTAVSSADFDTLRNLITAHLRIDRFVGGHLDSLLAKGYFNQVLERIQTLHQK